jgi:hypothetical protein
MGNGEIPYGDGVKNLLMAPLLLQSSIALPVVIL